MSKITLILEALFTGADEAEIKRRDLEAPKIMQQEWLESFLERKDVTKNSDGSYDVKGNVFMQNLGLTKIPVKFRNVEGEFWCDHNKLTSLEGAPVRTSARLGRGYGSFQCNDNLLTSLKDGPKEVGAYYWCDNNKLTSLEGAPEFAYSDFHCHKNLLTDLKGAPRKVFRDFRCQDNPILTSLEGAPDEVDGKFDARGCEKKFTIQDVEKVCSVKGNIYAADNDPSYEALKESKI